MGKTTRLRSRPVRTDKNIAAVAQSGRPPTLNHHCSQELDICSTSQRLFLGNDLCIPNQAYNVQLVQQLKSYEHSMRFRFTQRTKDRLAEDEHFYQKII